MKFVRLSVTLAKLTIPIVLTVPNTTQYPPPPPAKKSFEITVKYDKTYDYKRK